MSPADSHRLPPFKNLFRITLPEAFLLMFLVAVALGIAPGLDALGLWIRRRAEHWMVLPVILGLLAPVWVLIEALGRRCPFVFWSPYLCGFVILFGNNDATLHCGLSLMLVAGIAAVIASLLAQHAWWETAIRVIAALAPLTILIGVNAIP